MVISSPGWYREINGSSERMRQVYLNVLLALLFLINIYTVIREQSLGDALPEHTPAKPVSWCVLRTTRVYRRALKALQAGAIFSFAAFCAISSCSASFL